MRESAATQLRRTRREQAVREVRTRVLARQVHRLLDRGRVLELHVATLEQGAEHTDNADPVEPVTAVQRPLGLEQDREQDQDGLAHGRYPIHEAPRLRAHHDESGEPRSDAEPAPTVDVDAFRPAGA